MTMLPFTPAWFLKKKLFRSPSYFQSKIEDAIAAGPFSGSRASIRIDVRDAGAFKKPLLTVSGVVSSDTERAAVGGFIDGHARGVVEVVNELRVRNGDS